MLGARVAPLADAVQGDPSGPQRMVSRVVKVISMACHDMVGSGGLRATKPARSNSRRRLYLARRTPRRREDRPSDNFLRIENTNSWGCSLSVESSLVALENGSRRDGMPNMKLDQRRGIWKSSTRSGRRVSVIQRILSLTVSNSSMQVIGLRPRQITLSLRNFQTYGLGTYSIQPWGCCAVVALKRHAGSPNSMSITQYPDIVSCVLGTARPLSVRCLCGGKLPKSTSDLRSTSFSLWGNR